MRRKESLYISRQASEIRPIITVTSMGTYSTQLAGTPRPIAQAKSKRPNPKALPQLLMWRKLIDQAVQDSKRTAQGMPTDVAILARWWIAEHKPKQSEREEWERSFECACSWIDQDTAAYRIQLVAEIDLVLRNSLDAHVQAVIYVRRAMVLSCAGFPTAIAKQFVMPLVSKHDWEDVAGVDHGDRYVMYDRADLKVA